MDKMKRDKTRTPKAKAFAIARRQGRAMKRGDWGHVKMVGTTA